MNSKINLQIVGRSATQGNILLKMTRGSERIKKEQSVVRKRYYLTIYTEQLYKTSEQVYQSRSILLRPYNMYMGNSSGKMCYKITLHNELV